MNIIVVVLLLLLGVSLFLLDPNRVLSIERGAAGQRRVAGRLIASAARRHKGVAGCLITPAAPRVPSSAVPASPRIPTLIRYGLSNGGKKDRTVC